jgi:DNA-binding MarR family transcriptional regulator
VLFGPDLFSDPAWDIFLDLYLAELEDRKVLVSSVGRGAIAETTALRWLDRLEAAGWIRRVPDPVLGRRTYAVLTPKASGALRS